MKIASKISLSFLILTVVFASIFTSVFYMIANNNLKDNIYSNLNVIAQSKADTVETFLDSGKESIRQLSKSVAIEDFLLSFMKGDGEAYQKFNLVARCLRDTAHIMENTYDVFVLDKNGIVVASSDPADIRRDKSSDPYFLEGKKDVFIKDAYTSHTEKVDSITFSAPVYDESNTRLLGVVVSRVRMSAIDEILEKSTRLGETGEIYLINRNGYMITPSRFMKDTFLKLKVDTENSREALKHFTDTQAKHIEHKFSVFIDYSGTPTLGAYAIIPEMHWRLLAEIDESEALAPLEKLASIFMIIFLLIPLAAWPAGKFVARIITGPLHKLHEGTEIIGNGNLDHKIGTDAKDEVGQLSRAFDEMTEHLKETTISIDDLNKEIDERKHTEEALQKSEYHLKIVLDTVQSGIVTIREEGHVIVDANQCALKMIGASREEVIGKICHSYICPAEVGKCPITDLGQTVDNSERELLTADGKSLTILKTVVPFEIAGEKYLIGSFVDISNLKEAENTLRESEERYRQIVENANDIIFRTDDKGFFTFGNPIAARMAGYSEEEVMGIHFLELIRPDYRDEAAKFYGLQFAKKTKNSYYEYPVVKKDGTELWLGQNVQLIMKNDRIMGFQAVARDITDRRKLEEALRDSEETFRTISAAANDSIIMMDNEGKVIYWNEAAEKIFGYTSEEILGKELHPTLVPKQLLEAAETGFSKFKMTGQGAAVGKTLELAAIKKDDIEIPIELSMSAVKIGGEWNAVGLIRDITNRKLAEEALQKAKEEAENANLAKTEFLASMSHEIRTPMNAIIGMADLLQETVLDPEQLQYVQTFQSAGENLLSIINNILDISKVEAGHIQLETTDFNLNEMMEKICEVMAIRAHEKGLELTHNIMPGVPTSLLGDPVRLRQILINLMGNAIKFTGKGEVDVQVQRQAPEKQVSEDGKVKLVFSVIDTGIGIPPDKIDTIFEVFTQADSSTTRKYGGTGLGLSISKKLVELMDGNIRVESEPGHGSTFSFTAMFGVQSKPGKRVERFPVDLKAFKVLVVDDNATNRLILSKFLYGLGAMVTEAEDGKHGLAKFKRALEAEDPFHLALIDGRMPGMDGFELAGHLKEKTGGIKDTAIMMLTSDDRRDDIARCRELGISSYLVKPVKKKDLLDAIAVTLGRKTAPFVGRVPDVKPVDFSKVRPVNILLVEDSEDNRLLIQAYFKRTSDHIEIAENGEIAVKKFKSGKYDIVLMDVQMPVMDGYTATGEIRKWEKENGRKETTIIALTAHAMTEDFQKSLDAGCTDHLTKPIKKVTLMKTIQKYTVQGYGNTDS